MLLCLMFLFSVFCYYKPTVATGTYSIFTRSWGFDNITFYKSGWQILIYVVALFILIPYTNLFIQNLFRVTTNALARVNPHKILLFLCLAVLSVIAFYLFRVKYFFLGDFNLRLEQIMRGEVLSTEYLTMKALYGFAQLGLKFGKTPYQTFVYYSCMAGGVYVFFSCLIADLIGKNSVQKLIFFWAHVCTALLLVFFGYIEIYATVIALLSMYVYAGLRYLKFNNGFYLVVIILCLAVASHLLSLTLVPSLFMLWYLSHKNKFPKIAKANNFTLAGVIILFIIIAVLILVKKSGGLVLPLSPPYTIKSYMTLFSFRHLWEFINGQFLACGISFVIMPLLLWKLVKQKIQIDASTYFLLCISASIFIAIFLFNLHRGSGDWDIMASTAVAFNLATVLLITFIYTDNLSLQNYLLIVIVSLNFLHTFLWVNINHSDKSIHKIETMLATDPGTYYTRIPNQLELGFIYEANNLLKEAEDAGAKACNDHRFGDTRSCMFYAKKMLANNKPEECAGMIEYVLSWAPAMPDAYFYLLHYYKNTKQNEKFFLYLNKMFDAFVKQPKLFLDDSIYGKPDVYVSLFSVLFKEEYPKKNLGRLKKIDETVGQIIQLSKNNKPS